MLCPLYVVGEAGCHPWWNRLSNNQTILHNKPLSGLVIDDFFSLSAEPIQMASGKIYLGSSASNQILLKAKDAYATHGILGSEVTDSLHFKIIGAEVNSSVDVVKQGLVSLGAPATKRFGLMMLSACVANLPYTSDGLHASLIGSWISTLLYRRPMMAHINHLFQVIDASDLSPQDSKLRPLSRKAAEEL